MNQHDYPSTAGTVTVQPPDESGSSVRMKARAAFASFSGSLIEIYDFSIYGTAAALVFPQLFFSALGPAAGVIASFATYGVAFVARPVGSVLFGHFGDRLGRKKTLVMTLLMMGIATIFVGAMPTAEQIGVWAPIALVSIRLIQGLAAGGEWAGAMLFVTEHAPKGKRGFWAMFGLLGGTLAVTVGNGAFLLTGYGMSDVAFREWGWRLPFLASFVLIAVGLWIRLKVEETPVFKSQQARSGVVKMPFIDCLKRQPREVLLASGVGLTTHCLSMASATFITVYAVTTLKLSRTEILQVGVVSGIMLSIGCVIGAVLADRIGRRPVLLIAHVSGALLSLVLFSILDGATVTVFALVTWTLFLICGINYGPMGSFIPELFHTRYRYTGAGISYAFGTVIGGAIVPIIATALAAAYGVHAVGLLLFGLTVAALACTLALRETRNSDLDWVDVKA